MFIGHFAVGLASKRLAPRTSLALLLLAPLLLDLLWPLFLAAGLESVRIDPGNTAMTPLDLHDYPYTHSLAGSACWSFLLAGIYWVSRRDGRVAALLGAGVFSHWVLDFVTHRPDMPLYPGSSRLLGLGLWSSRAATIMIELLLFAFGLALYLRTTAARNNAGRIALWGLVGFLLVIYFMAAFGPPPPSARAVMIAGLTSWLFIPWAAWIDRNRQGR